MFFGDPDSASGFGIRSVNVAPGDRLVLCSDGVHGALGPDGWQAVAVLPSPHVSPRRWSTPPSRPVVPIDATALVVAFEGGRR